MGMEQKESSTVRSCAHVTRAGSRATRLSNCNPTKRGPHDLITKALAPKRHGHGEQIKGEPGARE
eukprot:719107-Pleurochrysis_carterae.AAC.5